MAARKSCTKLTWAEAKDKCGVGGGSKNPNKATLKLGQQPNHGKLLAAKIIAKSGPDGDALIKNRQAARMARRDQLRQEELDRQRELEKEQKRLEDVARPHETALEKLEELEAKFHAKLSASREDEDTSNDQREEEERNLVCESKQLQLDEVLALEAIYADTETLKISEVSQMEDLQAKIEEWQDDPDQIDVHTAIVDHPSISYTLRKSLDDPEDDDRVAHMLLHVRYPSNYPLETTPPSIEILWCMVTRKSLVVSSNKPLETIGILDQVGLLQSMSEEAEESLLGMPSVYELLDTWLAEHLFDYIEECPHNY